MPLEELKEKIFCQIVRLCLEDSPLSIHSGSKMIFSKTLKEHNFAKANSNYLKYLKNENVDIFFFSLAGKK